ncbi:MAG: response regulator [Cycloclasticus sp.]|nr:response regulator [Cycloclasticus sp.]MBQ0790641.1 response regulator [Cycloclasticus sp.]
MNKVQDVNIILIDADDRVRGYLRSMLLRFGFAHIRDVGSGEKALKEISLDPINLVFLDMNVPDIEGLELIKNIHERQPKCQIIVTSNSITEGLVRQITEAHIKRIILKPFNNHTIETKVREVLPLLYTTNWSTEPVLST